MYPPTSTGRPHPHLRNLTEHDRYLQPNQCIHHFSLSVPVLVAIQLYCGLFIDHLMKSCEKVEVLHRDACQSLVTIFRFFGFGKNFVVFSHWKI